MANNFNDCFGKTIAMARRRLRTPYLRRRAGTEGIIDLFTEVANAQTIGGIANEKL